MKLTSKTSIRRLNLPAAFRRLCVETKPIRRYCLSRNPAAFRRLCVETPNVDFIELDKLASRLQAAVC